MNLAAPFIARPVATILLTLGLVLAGFFAYGQLPVSPLPQVDFPTITVNAMLPGASPETVATSVASPLERYLGQIADVTEMTSVSSTGQARITLQFGLDRDINGAARDVQAAISAARVDLPTSLRNNPTYRKVNPADAPILILALTSETMTRGQIYDAASRVLSQRLSQINGVGQVIIGGAALPAVRVDLDPLSLAKYGIGLEDVRAAIASANANSPKGRIEEGEQRYQLYTNDQATRAADYIPLVVAYRKGNAVRLSDVAEVSDGVENVFNAALANGKPAVLVIVFGQPGANIIATVDAVKAALPALSAAMPADVKMSIANDRTPTIRAALADTQRTLLASVLLVTMVIFLFLRNARAALIPAVAVPVSIIGTFAAMYLLGYSLNNLSLMALTIATGFVVDDAIVVVENVSRHLENGLSAREAALKGVGEVGFTVVTISVSLIAVFIPILLMGGIVGRLFREFAMTLSLAILISLVVSLTTTPMMCARLLRLAPAKSAPSRGRWFDRLVRFYERSLGMALDHPALVLLILATTVILNFVLFATVPKGFFPLVDTGRMFGGIQADQNVSFKAMQAKLEQMVAIVQRDPAVQNVVGFTGQGSGGTAGQGNTASVFIALKPSSERDPITAVMGRLRRTLAAVPGARLYLQPVQDIRVGGRSSNAAYQYTLQADSAPLLVQWTPRLAAALAQDPVFRDVNTDLQAQGLETDLIIDRDAAARLGVTMSQIDNTLYDAFGQRQVSTIYSAQQQYHVIMEIAQTFWRSPESLHQIYVSTAGGSASGTQQTNALSGTFSLPGQQQNSATSTQDAARNAATNAIGDVGKGATSSGTAVSTTTETMVPLSAIAHYVPGRTPLAINHHGNFVANTISFNLAPGKSLSDAVAAIDRVVNEMHMPAAIHGAFAGTAATFQQSLRSEPLLIVAAFVAVYLVLGLLYESLIHPLTILSTLPSAGVGTVLAILLLHDEFNILSLIGIILLIGIVKKNAIMMIDFALEAERNGMSTREAIHRAAMLRLRPILMTTASAILGAIPLAVSMGEGSEMHRPLGIAIVGGLLVSQVLTLYTTPVVYLYLDRLRLALLARWRRLFPRLSGASQ